MARPAEPEKTQALLRRCYAAARTRGTLALTLAEFGAAAGTSPRMLVYHFGSHAGLQAALAELLEVELRDEYRRLEAAAGGAASLEEVVLRFWDHLATPSLRGLLGTVFDVMHRARAGDESAAALSEREALAWTELLQQRVADPALASALVLLVLGAVLDLLATGDAARGRAALQSFARAIGAVPGTRRR